MSYIGNVKVDSTTHLVGSTLYGTCNTAAGTKEKAVVCTNFDKLLTGVTIHVKFDNTNSIADPTLNVNSTGAKAIKRYGTTAPSTSVQTSWYAGAVISFTYDGTYWMMDDWTYTADGNTDTKVTQTATTTSSNYEILFSETADNTTRTEGARKNSNLTFNPSTGQLGLVGDIIINKTGATDSTQLQMKCGTNDYGRVAVGGTSNNGYIEIATADDGNEPIYARQYTGTYTSLKRSAILLDGAGNTEFPQRTKSKIFNEIITGSGTAAQDKGSGVSPRYFPAKWTFNTGLTATDGDIVTIKIPVAGHDYGVFMSIDNGTNYYPIVCNGTGRLTTNYPVNNYITVVFEPSGSAASMFPVAGGNSRVTVTDGVWRVINYYDSNSNDTGYYLRRIYPNIKAGSNKIFPYTLIMQLPDGRWESIVTSSSTGTSKARNTHGFLLTNLLLMDANATYNENAAVGTYNIWHEHTGLIDHRYSFNTANDSTNGTTGYKPVYIVGSLGNDGLFYLDTKWWTQTLPTSDDGKLYIYIGDAYDYYRLTFVTTQKIYWYKNGALREFIQDTATVTGHTVAKDVPSNAVFTDTNNAVTQTATSTNANYEVLFSATADNTTRTEGARKYSNLTFNPSTGNLNTTQINGVTVGSSPKFTDNDTHRPIKVNGTQLLGNNSTAVNFKAGSNITLSGSGSDITINASGGASHIRYNQTDDAIEVEDSNGVWHLYEHVGLDYLYWYKDGNYYPDYTGGWECDRSGATINYAYNGNSLRLFHPPDIANNLTWKMQQYNVPSSGFIGCHITYALMSSYYYSTNFTFYLVNSSGGIISQKKINVAGGSYSEHRANGELTLTGITSSTDKIGIKIYIDGDNHCKREVVLTDCYLFK